MRAVYKSLNILILLVKCSYCLFPKDEGTRYSIRLYDNISNPGNGKNYKLMYNSKNWTDAVEACAMDNGILAVPKTKVEFDFLQIILKEMYYPAVQGTDDKLIVWLGISNLENNTVWKTVQGEEIEKLPFHSWALGNGGTSEDRREPHCVVIDATNTGLRDYWCYKKQPFICEYEQ